MARLEDLVARIADRSLRQELEAAIADLKRRKHFGLVFEEHIPEISVLHGLPVEVGATVLRRSDAAGRVRYSVTALTSDGITNLANMGK